mmetsp:Transcript_24078/g.55609  ORF Transcript_24078/g.55609 Transcript_24078/m.55609 type:complete len:202 (+) Transcript_24078:262-867(+)
MMVRKTLTKSKSKGDPCSKHRRMRTCEIPLLIAAMACSMKYAKRRMFASKSPRLCLAPMKRITGCPHRSLPMMNTLRISIKCRAIDPNEMGSVSSLQAWSSFTCETTSSQRPPCWTRAAVSMTLSISGNCASSSRSAVRFTSAVCVPCNTSRTLVVGLLHLHNSTTQHAPSKNGGLQEPPICDLRWQPPCCDREEALVAAG